jgi:hypothetical protein
MTFLGTTSMYKMILFFSFLLVAGGCSDTCGTVQEDGTTDARAPTSDEPDARDQPDRNLEPGYFPDAFQSVSIRGHAANPRIEGNSLEGAQGAFDQGVRYVEIDFEMSGDEYIIAAHGNHLGGDCPNVSDSTIDLLRACKLEGGLSVATGRARPRLRRHLRRSEGHRRQRRAR